MKRLFAVVLVSFGFLETPLCGAEFRAGAVITDITPQKFPRIIAGGFLEGRGEKIVSKLSARSIVLDDGKMQIAFCIVDTCMMEQSLIDEAKAIASKQCGIPTDRMMVSATHTHSAPAAMGCLGTRKDTEYADFLIPKIAESIVEAHKRLQPAKIGWGSIDDWEHTHNRRWIRLIGKEVVDPFGQPTGRANMHPGYLSKDVVGPSGPVDPQLSVISIRTLEDKPLAVLANYSQHYFGQSPISADYFGIFNSLIEERLGGGICAMSQGTSGDQMWMDYGAEKKNITIENYAAGVAEYALKALQAVKHQGHAQLGMIEKTLELPYRVPDEKRLAWARPIAAKIENDVPKTKEEVYAREALILHERQKTSVKLQAIRIGDCSIATLPNEVYAITGLKLREYSPFKMHFNIELANGAEGYIPPPEQHELGGYTTWPARTAGLHRESEPVILKELVMAGFKLAGGVLDKMPNDNGPFAQAVIKSSPLALFRCNELSLRDYLRNDAANDEIVGAISGGVALHLPGAGSGEGYGSGQSLRLSAFSGKKINRSIHLTGGHIQVKKQEPSEHASIALWFWLGHESGASDRRGHLIDALGASLVAHQDANHHVQLKWSAQSSVRSESGDLRSAQGTVQTTFADDWHFVVLIRDGEQLRVHLDGSEKPVLTAKAGHNTKDLIFGKGLQGKLDEITVWDRVIEPKLISDLWAVSKIGEENAARAERRTKRKAAQAEATSATNWSASIRFKNNRSNTAGPVTGYLISRGPKGDHQAPGDHLGIGGTYKDAFPGKLIVFNGNAANQVLLGKTVIQPGTWNTAKIDREGLRVKVWLNDQLEIDADLPVTAPEAKELFFGKRCDDFAPLEGEFEVQSGAVVTTTSPTQQAGRLHHTLQVPEPLSPEASLAKLHLRKGFTASLIATEPEVLDPVAFDWDDEGNLWVIEMADYPLGMDGKGKPGGRLVILSEADKTGRYQKRKVVVDDLSFPTGVLTWRDGALVTAAPDMLFIKPNGEKKVLLTGFSEGNQQLRVNGLRWGMDGWVYCAGGAHTVNYNKTTSIESKLTGQKIELGARDFRFKPDTGEIDPQTGPSQFGRVRDDWGHWFGVQNSKPLWHVILEDHELRDTRIIPPDPVRLMYPLNPTVWATSEPEKRYHSFGHATTYTSACGINIYRGGQMFRDDKTHAFTCEPFHNLVQHHILEDDGVSFKASVDHDGKTHDFFASEDRWCRPVMVRDGPDGALYIADMYRLMIEHPQWLPKEGQDELLPHYRKGEDKGRIYRITQTNAPIANDSGWRRDRAQMKALWNNEPFPFDHKAQAAWTLHLQGKLKPTGLAKLFTDPNPRVREQAVLMAESYPELQSQLAILAKDPDAKVRLQLALSCKLPLPELLKDNDPYIRWAASSALGPKLDTLPDDALTLDLIDLALGNKNKAVAAKIAGKHLGDPADLLLVLEKLEPWNTSLAELGLQLPDGKHSPLILTLNKPTRQQGLAALTPGDRTSTMLLAKYGGDDTAERLMANFTQRTPAEREAILDAMTSTQPLTLALFKLADPTVFDSNRRAQLNSHPNKTIRQAAEKFFATSAVSARKDVLEKFKSSLTLPGDPTNGKQVFLTAGCIACHQLDGVGIPLGPDLRTVVQHTNEKLFNSILDPSAIIEPGFTAYHCTLNNGEQLYGIIATETSSSLTLKMAGNLTRSILRSEIKTLQSTKSSLMPDGIEVLLTPQSLADLMAYLKSQR